MSHSFCADRCHFVLVNLALSFFFKNQNDVKYQIVCMCLVLNDAFKSHLSSNMTHLEIVVIFLSQILKPKHTF